MQKMMAAVALALMPGAVQACTYLAPFEMGRIGGAELVIVGEVTGYDTLPVSGLGAALVTVKVEESLKGRLRGEVTFIWNSGLAQGPHEGRARGRVLIGAMMGGRLAVSDRTPDERPDLPSIIQPYCGDVWMQPATSAMVEAAREALE